MVRISVPFGFDRGNQTTVDDRAVHQYRARAAFAFAATFFRAGQMHFLAQDVQQPRHRVSLHAAMLAVHRAFDFNFADGFSHALTFSVMASISTSGVTGISRRHNASGVLDGVHDRGRGTIHGQFADPFRAAGPKGYGCSSKNTRIGGISAAVGMM